MGLFGPAWISKDKNKALAAVETLSDNNKLYSAAAKSPYSDVRYAAVKRMTDQHLLYKLVTAVYLNEQLYYDESLAAVDNISDDQLLEQLAVGHKQERIRKQACLHLKDQELLYSIACTDPRDDVRSAASSQLHDNKLWIKLLDATQGNGVVDSNIRYYALTNLSEISDQMLRDIALREKSPNIAIKAASRITDMSMLREVALRSNYQIREACVCRILSVIEQYDQKQLAAVAQNDKLWEVRKYAVERLDDQAVLTQVAVTEKESSIKDNEVRKAAVKRISDQSSLQRIAFAQGPTLVREIAIEKLDDPEIKTQIALQDTECAIPLYIMDNYSTPTLLAKVCCFAKNNLSRRVALKKLEECQVTTELVSYIAQNAQYCEAFDYIRGIYKSNADVRDAIKPAYGRTYTHHRDESHFNQSECTTSHSDLYTERIFEL